MIKSIIIILSVLIGIISLTYIGWLIANHYANKNDDDEDK